MTDDFCLKSLNNIYILIKLLVSKGKRLFYYYYCISVIQFLHEDILINIEKHLHGLVFAKYSKYNLNSGKQKKEEGIFKIMLMIR